VYSKLLDESSLVQGSFIGQTMTLGGPSGYMKRLCEPIFTPIVPFLSLHSEVSKKFLNFVYNFLSSGNATFSQ
jgi:hypothetical protein